MLGLGRNFLANLRSSSLIDLAVGLAEALPSGLYDGRGVQQYLEKVLSDPDRANDFRLLENELYLTATDLDTCERIVLGGPDWDDVPISRAVAASTALPMVYKPVEIKGRHLVDGGIRSTTNVDVAVEAGAKFVVVVNPLVPYVNDFQKVIPTMWGSRVRRVRDMGFPQIGYQAFKLLAHQRLHEAVAHWKERYPGVDIILIEPDPNDELMFETNILNFTRRVEIARHGFESVTLKLATDYDDLKAICAKHGIEISATRVRKVVEQVRAGARAHGGLAAHPRADDDRAAAAVRGRLGRSAAAPALLSGARITKGAVRGLARNQCISTKTRQAPGCPRCRSRPAGPRPGSAVPPGRRRACGAGSGAGARSGSRRSRSRRRCRGRRGSRRRPSPVPAPSRAAPSASRFEVPITCS